VRTLRPSSIGQGLAIICIFTAAAFFSSHRVVAQSGPARLGLPHDWSHRHVVFSSTQDIPLLLKIRQDPRILHQWLRHNAMGSSGANVASIQQPADEFQTREVNPEMEEADAPEKEVDWSVTLGGVNSILPRNQYPAKYTFDITAPPSCVNDYVVFPTNHVGVANQQATIVAFNHLYSTQGAAGGFCNQNGPSVKWSYNTGGLIRSSPVLSLDGTKVAWVARINGIVHVLTVGTTGNNGASVTAPVTPGAGNNAVDTRVTLNGGPRVTQSSLFVDYTTDVGYVGDDRGVLHKITGVFNGTPAEVTTGGWPISVSFGGAALNNPVFDSTSKNIFVTDGSGRLSYVRETGSAVGTCVISGAPPCLGFPVLPISSGGAIMDAPVVDFVTERVFTETAASGTNSQIVQTDAALGNVVKVNVGQQDAAHPLHSGAFDNNYFNNVSTGFYYVCGKAAASTNSTLYRIGFNASGVMNAAPDATTRRLARAAAECSPITEVFNTGSNPRKDWLFVAVSTRCGASVLIGGGCIMSFDATAGMPAAANAFVMERNGTSGIIIDNVSNVTTFPQASNIYFTNEGIGACGDGIATGGCAIKLTQAGLK
jgi:hypothetical protein